MQAGELLVESESDVVIDLSGNDVEVRPAPAPRFEVDIKLDGSAPPLHAHCSSVTVPEVSEAAARDLEQWFADAMVADPATNRVRLIKSFDEFVEVYGGTREPLEGDRLLDWREEIEG